MTTHDGNANNGGPQSNRSVSRRNFLKVAVVGAGATVLTACGVTGTPSGGTGATASGAAASSAASGAAASAPASGAGGGTALEFWAFSEDRLKFVRELIQSSAWTSAHPGVTVNFRVFPYNEMHDKLLAALASGQGAPDIADVEISRFSRFIKGERVGFVPLNDRIGSEIDNLYTAAATAPWSWQGQIYGLGNELNTCVLGYRKDVFDAAGITTPFATWDDVIAAGKQISNDQRKMFAIHDINSGDWYQMAQHAGTTMFDDQGNYQADNEKSVAAMQFLHDLVHVHQIAGIAPAEAADDWAPPTYKAAYAAEQFVATFGAPWHFGGLIPAIPDQSGKWVAQAFPKGLGDSRPTANHGGTGQCITEQSKNADLAWELIKICNLTKEGVLTDFRIRTAYPAYKPAYEDATLQEPSEFFGGQKIGELYSSIATEIPEFKQSPVWPEATEAMNRIVITPVMQNQKDAKTALTELGTEVDRLKQQG
ncbi:MAG TPA: substrate-binding domain-containing protein [Herpetosiphonaceae bacterium]